MYILYICKYIVYMYTYTYPVLISWIESVKSCQNDTVTKIVSRNSKEGW